MCLRCLKSSSHPGAKVECVYTPAPLALVFDYEASLEERRRIRFFVDRTIPSIEVFNSADREFWTELVVKGAAGGVGGSLRCAVLSIEAYHESLLLTSSGNGSERQDGDDEMRQRERERNLRYAQLQYSKAIKSAAAAKYDNHAFGLGELLALSIAMRSIEVFRNQLDNAYMHLSAGRAVLDEAVQSNMHSELIRGLLKPMMQRLEFKSLPVSTITNGDIAGGAGAEEDGIERDAAASIERAREKGHAILSLVCHGIQQTASSPESRNRFIDRLFSIIGKWYKEVLAVTKRLPKHGPAMESAIYAKIQFWLLMAALRIRDARDESAYDTLGTAFEKMISLCEECAEVSQRQASAAVSNSADPKANDEPESPPPIKLSLGAELVATAFFVGTCFRDSGIRRRALRFLGSEKRREPRWYSPHAAAILEWAIREEEGGIDRNNPNGEEDSTDRFKSSAEGERLPSRIRLGSLSYYHDLTATPLDANDPALSFEMPTWICIEYAHILDSSRPSERKQHWIHVPENSSSEHNTTQHFSEKPDSPMALAFQVEEPLMPSTAAMIVLARRSGEENGGGRRYSCDAVLSNGQTQAQSHAGEQTAGKQCAFVGDTGERDDRDGLKGLPMLCSIRNLAPEKLAM